MIAPGQESVPRARGLWISQGDLAHQREDVFVHVEKEGHPQFVVCEGGDFVWFAYEGDAPVS